MGMIDPDPSRFFDPNRTDGVLAPPVVTLNRVSPRGTEEWQLLHTIGYRDRHVGRIIAPADKVTFFTDLTSVPQLMTWLVPRTGQHLPAALIHDALTPPEDGQFILEESHDITQRDADRIFRDGMGDLGTPKIQRWLIWAAVSIPTAGKMAGRLWGVVLYSALLLTAFLGVLATLDILGIAECVPWMRGDDTWEDLALGCAGAAVIPIVLTLPWATVRLYRAGLICCWGIAFLLHATVVLLIATGIYQIAERWFGDTKMAPLLPAKLRATLRRRWYLVVLGLAAIAAVLTGLTMLLCRLS
jgi:hypothetical protein